MLHKETVTADTLALIRKLQSDDLFVDFYLVGGTALSLQIGHRKSIDIDLFTRKSFDTSFYIEHLEQKFNFSLQFSHDNTLKGTIKDVFVDLIKHDYELVKPLFEKDGIKMLSREDIAAMKVNAIASNGTRAKDFVDIYFLLKEFTFGEIIHHYALKYKHRNTFHAVKSLTYFDDIIEEEWPVMVREKDLNLEKLKTTITKARDKYLSEMQDLDTEV